MSLRVTDELPAIEALREENIHVLPSTFAKNQDIRPMKLAILNLMPNKVETEIQLLRLLANTPLQIDADLVRIEHHASKHTSENYLTTFYKTFAEVKQTNYDGLIITGAPLGKLDYEEVTYWSTLTEIFDWAKERVTSTLFLCWAAHAALYYYYGLQRDIRDQKACGVYRHRNLLPKKPLLRGFDDEFWAPHSRYAYVPEHLIREQPELEVLASSEIVGPYLIKDQQGSQIYVTGHPEYDAQTLHQELIRDIDAGLSPVLPENYYPGDDMTQTPSKRWQSHAFLLFSNWLNYYVYQATPYDLNEISQHVRTDNYVD
ncbi:homoserine O-succinyltransferase [Algicola sagamiensis]|uniref:homoserine O-succinyltransferase n=1 Tax=Algicola sagamiensis TaxID=163869 RepID=UPI00036448B5|nr:homoserine O-succinyltransferase [Algicola sagamiensis]